jgi:hypothetical protein
MSAILLKRQWAQQPAQRLPIDWGHKILKGVNAAIIAYGDTTDWAINQGKLIAAPTVNGTFAKSVISKGRSLAFNGSDTYLAYDPANIPADEFTLLVGGVFGSLSGVTGIVDCSNGSTSGWSLFTSGTDMYLSGNHWSGDLLSSGWTTGSFFHLAARNKAGVGKAIFRNGVKIASSGLALAGVSNPVNPLWFGRLKVSSPQYVTGNFAYFYLLDKYLSDDAIKSISENQWRILAWPSLRIPVGTASAGGAASISGAGQIASAEAFGTSVLLLQVSVAGLATGEGIGSVAISGAIAAGGVTSLEAMGSPAFATAIIAAGIANAEAFGQPNVGIAAQEIAGAGNVGSAEALGQPALTVSIEAAGTDSAEAIGRASLLVAIAAASISTTEAIGQPDVGGDPAQEITSAGIADAVALGQPSAGAAVQASGIPSAQALGQPNVGAAAAEIAAIGITSAETLGSPAAAASINAAAMASAEAAGSPAIDVRINAAGATSTAAVGAPIVGEILPAEITGAGAIAAAEAFGQVSVYPRLPYTGTGFQPGSGHRRPVRNRVARQIELNKIPHGIGAGGIASGERFGYPALKWGGRSRKVRDEEFLLRRAA